MTATLEDRRQTVKAPCPQRRMAGRSAIRQTVLHYILAEHLARVGDEAYRFCPQPDCEVVYHRENGIVFKVTDLRDLVSEKTGGDERPLCYCFGFTEGHMREEIARTGSSAIQQQIGRFIKAGLCACEARNPSGARCLGQVNQTVKRLAEECKASCEPTLVPSHDCYGR
jgi:hypothetical protein